MTTELDKGSPAQMRPPEADAGGSASTGAASAPTLTAPPVAAAASVDAGPKLEAPGAVAEGGVGGVTAATWRTGQVTGLWSIDETRNAWMLVSAIGWRKLFNGRDGAFQALVTLASQARQTGRTINFREEADGMVYEIYLW